MPASVSRGETDRTAGCLVCGSSAPHVGDKNGHPFHRCGECGLLFVWPLPDGNLEIYSEDYFAGARDGFGYVDYDRDKSAMEDTFESYLDLLAGRHPQLGDLLDVGAATGFFLDLARRRGWKTCGVEPSKYASLVASQKNLTVHCGVLEELNLPDASFDVVTMWDVIEHVNDPGASLKAACRLLRPAGTLALNTPDAGSLLARLLGLKWHLVVPPEHLVLFGQESVRRLLEASGFTVTALHRIGKRFTIQYILQTLARWQGLSLWHKAAGLSSRWRFGNWGIPINLRDNMFVLARKTD